MARSSPKLDKPKKTNTKKLDKSFVKAVLDHADMEIRTQQVIFDEKKEVLREARQKFKAFWGTKSRTQFYWQKVEEAKQAATEAGSDLWTLYMKYFHTGVIEMVNGDKVRFIEGRPACTCAECAEAKVRKIQTKRKNQSEM